MHLNTDGQKAQWALLSEFIDEVMRGRFNNTEEDFQQFLHQLMSIFDD